jgi:hypothetical protein
MQTDIAFRAQVLRRFGADSEVEGELLRYNENVFREMVDLTGFPLPDEPFIPTWQQYQIEAEREGTIAVLARYLVQLRFPTQAGISVTSEYVAATRRGEGRNNPGDAEGLWFVAPEQCRLVCHATPAGRIPLIIAGEREDFVALVRALTKRNEPVDVPNSMGACMVAGYINWDRFHKAVADAQAVGRDAEEAFTHVKTQKHLYQDRFILLSSGPYSGVSASDVGLDNDRWRQTSLLIRREHECAHYFTRRVFSSMRNNLLDELIADYCGITAAAGRYRADWFLRFLGLESLPHYREGARLQNYRGDPPLSDRAFALLARLVAAAATNLEAFARNRLPDVQDQSGRARMLLTLASLTLEELACADAQRLMADRFPRSCVPQVASMSGTGGGRLEQT